MSTGGRVVVGGRVLVVWGREQAVLEHARRAGAGIGRPASQSCASRPPLSSPVHLCPISPPALTPLASPWSCRAPAPLLALLACTCGPRRLQSGWCSYYPAVLYFMNRKEAAAARTDAESLQECQLPADHQYFSHLVISISLTKQSVFLQLDHRCFCQLIIDIFHSCS